MDKKLAYQIQIHLYTDGDFAFREDLLPHAFKEDDCREIILISDTTFLCNIYDKNMTEFGWKLNEWGTYTARSTIEQYVSAIHVSFTHLYIWEDLLRCVEECSDWLYHPEKFEDKNLFISSISGNYDGTDFIIKRVKEIR